MIVGAHNWLIYHHDQFGNNIVWKCTRCRIELASQDKPTLLACSTPKTKLRFKALSVDYTKLP